MNKGRHFIRNTVLAFHGVVVLFFGLNRLLAATVSAGAPEWVVNATTLGLASWAKSGAKPRYLTDLELHDFTRLSVKGRFTVEIVGAPQYRISFTAADGRPLPLRVEQQGDRLWLTGFTGTAVAGTAVLCIEMPTLAALDVRQLTGLKLRGLQAPELTVDLNDVPAAHLVDNKVARWVLHSDSHSEVQVDKATLAAGSVQVSGDVTLHTDQ